MFRLRRLTDYGIVLMAHLASCEEGSTHAAREVALETQLPLPVVSKVLKSLARGGLLRSVRGAKGGYSLARPATRRSAHGRRSCGWRPTSWTTSIASRLSCRPSSGGSTKTGNLTG